MKEGRGNTFITFLKKKRTGDCVNAINSRIKFRIFGGNYTRRPSMYRLNCESLWKKIIGKPYSGKLNVRFDEGELETGYGCDIVALRAERVSKQ